MTHGDGDRDEQATAKLEELVRQRTAALLERVAQTEALALALQVENLRRKQAEAEARRLSLFDDLTTARNRRGFGVVVEQARRGLARRGARGALVFCDVDGLKKVNDHQGHVAGDRLLVAVAAALEGAVRASDVVARWGGDEFVVFLADTDAPEAVRRLRQELADAGVPASLGAVTVAPDDERPLDELVHAADAAMYADKSRRREQVVDITGGSRTRPAVAASAGARC